jgi:hypothetical protein
MRRETHRIAQVPRALLKQAPLPRAGDLIS